MNFDTKGVGDKFAQIAEKWDKQKRRPADLETMIEICSQVL